MKLSTSVVVAALAASACSGGDGGDPPTTAAAAMAPTTTAEIAVVYEDGQPGSCRVLEEKYCHLGKLVYFENGAPFVAFSLPEATPLFAFRGGEAFEINVDPAGPGNYDPEQSYRAVHIGSEGGARNTLVLFVDVSAEPNVHLKTVEEGEVIGYLTADTLPVLPGGIQVAGDNLLVQILGFPGEPDMAAYEELFGLTP